MMQNRSIRGLFFVSVASVFVASACNVVLGLDDYTKEEKAIVCEPGKVQQCAYNGPPGTENVGVCQSGTQTCKMDGTGYEPCAGEVTPAMTEDCSNAVDDTCDGQINEMCPCKPNSQLACYSGPMDTEDVGICKGGMQTCNPDGLGYGPCNGEQAPMVEDCTKPEDENCDGYKCGDSVWAIKLDGVTIFDIALDDSGNIYAVGTLDNSFMMGSVSFTSGGGKDVVVLKFDPLGNILWGRKYGGTMDDYAYGIDVDDAGNAYLTGYTSTSIDFGGGPQKPGVVVVKLDKDGNHAWSKGCAGTLPTPPSYGRGIAVNGPGDTVYVTGTFGGTLSCVIGMSLMSAGNSDAFVMRMSGENGGPIWSKNFGDNVAQGGIAIGMDSNKDVLLAGIFLGSINLGGGPLSTPNQSMFVAKLGAAAGAHIWSTAGSGTPSSLAVDSANNVIVSGWYTGPTTIGGSTLNAVGFGTDIFLGKFAAADGTAVWLQGFGGTSGDLGDSVAIGPGDRFVLGGSFRNSTDFGGGPLASGNLDAAFVAVFDDMKSHLWSKQFSGQQMAANSARAVDIGPNSEIVAAGYFGGTVDFGLGPLMATQGGSAFLVRFAP